MVSRSAVALGSVRAAPGESPWNVVSLGTGEALRHDRASAVGAGMMSRFTSDSLRKSTIADSV